ncbi:hypothetical protein niasHS_009255 [Heterodera schachtii]|uniref:Uncharacterized protein n=1 Tax=Heterodera schachtii TaxID=97005 RepID=A0ABD2IX39_HETSC
MSKAIQAFGVNSSEPSNSDLQIAAAEGTWSYHIARHAQSFASSDCASSLFKTIFPDSSINLEYGAKWFRLERYPSIEWLGLKMRHINHEEIFDLSSQYSPELQDSLFDEITQINQILKGIAVEDFYRSSAEQKWQKIFQSNLPGMYDLVSKFLSIPASNAYIERVFSLFQMDIFFDSKRFARLYNCTSYRVDDIPFEQRQNVPVGISMIAIFLPFSSLHAICLFAMRKFVAHSSAYTVMFLMGVGHICSLSVTDLLTGLFSLCGIVFCSAPSLIFFAGSMALFCWSLTTSLSVLLALERCVEQTLPNLAKSLFDGCRIWLWCLAILAYSFYYGFFTIPITFSGITANWQFDPHVGYLEDSSESGQNLFCFFCREIKIDKLGL